MTSSILLSSSGWKYAFNSSITNAFIAANELDCPSFEIKKPMLRLPLEIASDPTLDVMTTNVFLNETLRPY